MGLSLVFYGLKQLAERSQQISIASPARQG